MVHTASWERTGEPETGGVGAIRRVGRAPQYAREQIVEYEPPSHLAYTVLSGIPVRDYRAHVWMRESSGRTEIEWSSRFTPRWPGTGFVLERLLHASVRSLARRLAAAAERAT